MAIGNRDGFLPVSVARSASYADRFSVSIEGRLRRPRSDDEKESFPTS